MVLCKNKLAIIKNNGQDLIKTGDAFTVTSDGSKKEIADNKKQIIRCFNAKCDNLLVNLSVKNIDTARSKISKSFESSNKIFSVDGISLRSKLLELNLEELNRVYTYALKKEQERELEKEKETVMEREANARAGFVYVISNIGSFGENIYKIGMTRRLEPMDRVKELSSASVPFEFDVHAMIFSENAPELESTLHKHFEKQSVNRVNLKKEFFHVSLDEIEKVVLENYNNTVEFTRIPVANEYRQTQAILESER